jgi:phosphoglycolate phosphatase
MMLPTHHRAIAFDFDGTLIDSAPAILSGMRYALEKNKIAPTIPLEPGIIGPPLGITLSRISGSTDQSLLTQLIADFKHGYDSSGLRDTVAYQGIPELLDHLHHKGYRLYLATNKRGIPTRLILDYLRWHPWFSAVYCLDEHPNCADKTQLLGKLLLENGLIPSVTPYVGDTESDASAAIHHHMPYLHVAWGYGQQLCQPSSPAYLCSTAGQLQQLLEQSPWS